MRRHRERDYEGKPYPMMINGAKAVMACRILFSLFHRRDNSLQVAARGSVNGPLSLCMPLGDRATCRACCQVRYRRGSVLDLNPFA